MQCSHCLFMIDIRHVARLARIELCDEEEKRFQKEISGILTFVEKLNELDTQNVPPMAGGTLLENSMRPDEQKTLLLEKKSQELLDAVPEKKGAWVKVKRILG